MSISGVGSGNSYLYQGVNRGNHRNKGNAFFSQTGTTDEPGPLNTSERSREFSANDAYHCMAMNGRSRSESVTAEPEALSDAAALKKTEQGGEVQKKTSSFLDMIGSQAPEEVRQAWKEAEKESGGFFTTFGLFITNDGKHAFMTQAGIDRFVREYRGEKNHDNLLGNSVESAIRTVRKWMYDFDHPLAGQYPGGAQEQSLYRMERKFYETFLQKLQGLSV